MTDLHSDRWQLPDGVEELLPDTARAVDQLRRRFTDLCHQCGYELVMPPLIEFIDSLLTGTGEQMNLQTFKFVDQHNGRTLGIRADMTPQVARIDAHALRTDQPNRLFYTGTVLRARTDGFGGSRTLQQFGAELFGHAGSDSDIEIIRLMLDAVAQARPDPASLLLDLGHVGVYASLVERSGLDVNTEKALFAAMQRGSMPEVLALLEPLPADNPVRAGLPRLLRLRGGVETLARASEWLGGLGQGVGQALATLEEVVQAMQHSHPHVPVQIDLAELRGYRYHTGVLFSVHDADGEELAHGGRYDSIGAAFGRARPATGFSGNLVQMAGSLTQSAGFGDGRPDGIFVAAADTAAALEEIGQLRARGERVVTGLAGSALTASATHCSRRLVWHDDQWQVQPENEQD